MISVNRDKMFNFKQCFDMKIVYLRRDKGIILMLSIDFIRTSIFLIRLFALLSEIL